MSASIVPHDGFAFGALCIVALLALVAMILAYRVFRGEPKTHRTRLGVFVERDRFDEPEEWPASSAELGPPPEARTLPSWPDRPTDPDPNREAP